MLPNDRRSNHLSISALRRLERVDSAVAIGFVGFVSFLLSAFYCHFKERHLVVLCDLPCTLIGFFERVFSAVRIPSMPHLHFEVVAMANVRVYALRVSEVRTSEAVPHDAMRFCICAMLARSRGCCEMCFSCAAVFILFLSRVLLVLLLSRPCGCVGQERG